jgi:Micro-fibrillar-associated protein 1 C-terminus.
VGGRRREREGEERRSEREEEVDKDNFPHSLYKPMFIRKTKGLSEREREREREREESSVQQIEV